LEDREKSSKGAGKSGVPKMMLEGFMEPWNLGRTLEEAKTSLREYGRMGFGLS
jgi:hypothetical protein